MKKNVSKSRKNALFIGTNSFNVMSVNFSCSLIVHVIAGTAPIRAEDVEVWASWNKRNHRCGEYETEGLIVRRGQPFSIQVEFSRPYNRETDKIALLFAAGK